MAHAFWRWGTVRVVGTGLLGTSVGQGLRAAGVDVVLHDISPDTVALARDFGAGSIDGEAQPGLVVVATPPDVTADVIVAELCRWPDAVVTDVASVKETIATRVRQQAGPAAGRYVGGHPMAGRERSGAVAARGDLFTGRPWVLTPLDDVAEHVAAAVRELAVVLGGMPVVMSPHEHDEVVARVSHLPQIAASLVAARLLPLDEQGIGLAGQGVRDVTRIAASDPALWVQILGGNADRVAGALLEFVEDAESMAYALQQLAADWDATGARARLARPLEAGVRGHARIPGKPGAAAVELAVVTVMVRDQPGELGRLLTEMGAAGINLEELRMDHVPGRAVGMVAISVQPAAREPFLAALAAGGWTTVA
jgi:prephenate dehydrogenase